MYISRYDTGFVSETEQREQEMSQLRPRTIMVLNTMMYEIKRFGQTFGYLKTCTIPVGA